MRPVTTPGAGILSVHLAGGRIAAPADEATVGEYMTTDVEVVRPDEPLPVVAQRMVEAGVSHLPVIDAEGKGLGILTTTDPAESLSTANVPAQSDYGRTAAPRTVPGATGWRLILSAVTVSRYSPPRGGEYLH